MLKVLVVDDQRHVLDALELLFEMRGGLAVVKATAPEEALATIAQGGIGVVLHDMNFSEGTTTGAEGVELFRAIRRDHPDMPVVLMTAWASLELAVGLVKEGADDFLQKPWDDEALLKKVTNLLRAREHQAESAESSPGRKVDLCGLLFESAPMHAVVSLALKVASSNAPVLVTGPNGTGKEKIAEIVQANSARKSAPFIKVNVGALPEELFAAELFGAEAGAFTGARARRVGRFEAADGGTLFLDEMGNLSLESQAKLLRALQSGEFERLGSSQTRKADVRVIAATNVNMQEAISAGRFREDLYYRLAVIELYVPPLCERIDDIAPLARAFVQQYCTEGDAGAAGSTVLTDALITTLQAHAWPGNVRELQNRMRRGLLMAGGAEIESVHLGFEDGASRSAGKAPSARPSSPPSGTLRVDRVGAGGLEPDGAAGTNASSLDQAERETLERALHEANYVVSHAAHALGLSRQALYRRMQRLGLKLKKDVEQ